MRRRQDRVLPRRATSKSRFALVPPEREERVRLPPLGGRRLRRALRQALETNSRKGRLRSSLELSSEEGSTTDANAYTLRPPKRTPKPCQRLRSSTRCNHRSSKEQRNGLRPQGFRRHIAPADSHRISRKF